MDKLIRDRLKHIQRTLKAAYEASQELKSEHSTITGTEREIFVTNFLREMFPPQFRFGSGAIIDKDGHKTGQLDIVIELPFTPSFTLGQDTPRIYLADTIGAVIEVKSDLRRQWNDFEKQLKFKPPSEDGSKSVYALKEVERGVSILEEPSKWKLRDKLSNTIPAYVVGYRGYSTLGWLKRKMKERNNQEKNDKGDLDPWIRGALQVEPPMFVGSDENADKYSCQGAEAFGAFIASLDFELQRVVWGHADLWGYFGINTDAKRSH